MPRHGMQNNAELLKAYEILKSILITTEYSIYIRNCGFVIHINTLSHYFKTLHIHDYECFARNKEFLMSVGSIKQEHLSIS
jgi:hypothetical protein